MHKGILSVLLTYVNKWKERGHFSSITWFSLSSCSFLPFVHRFLLFFSDADKKYVNLSLLFDCHTSDNFCLTVINLSPIYFSSHNMLIRKRPKDIFRLLGLSTLFTICLLLIGSLVIDDHTPTTFIAPDVLQNSSNSCRSQPLFSGLTKFHEQRCYPLLINFADGCCKRAQKNNCLTGLQYGLHQCVMFNKQILEKNPDFVARNKQILQRKRGAGYWLWKPYIIFQELYLASEGDIIVYSDASVDLVANISHLIKLTEQQDILVF